MNIGPNHPSGGSGGGKGRRRRGRRGGPGGGPGGPRPGGQQGHGGQGGQGGPGGGGGGFKGGGGGGGGGFKRRRQHGGGGGGGAKGQNQRDPQGIYTRPMDHSYRNGGQGNPRGHVPGAYVQPEPEPIRKPVDENAAPRIFAFIEDLFFNAKINETAKKLGIKVEFVRTDKDILERIKNNGDEKPSLIIFDLNNANAKPLTTIPKLKKELKKGTAIIGFLSHLQADLKVKAQEAGCDMVLPRSSFSQNLPSLLRRHGADEEEQ